MDINQEAYQLFQNIIAPALIALVTIFLAIGEAWLFIKSFNMGGDGDDKKSSRHKTYSTMVISFVVYLCIITFLTVGVYGVWNHFTPNG